MKMKVISENESYLYNMVLFKDFKTLFLEIFARNANMMIWFMKTSARIVAVGV